MKHKKTKTIISVKPNGNNFSKSKQMVSKDTINNKNNSKIHNNACGLFYSYPSNVSRFSTFVVCDVDSTNDTC